MKFLQSQREQNGWPGIVMVGREDLTEPSKILENVRCRTIHGKMPRKTTSSSAKATRNAISSRAAAASKSPASSIKAVRASPASSRAVRIGRAKAVSRADRAAASPTYRAEAF